MCIWACGACRSTSAQRMWREACLSPSQACDLRLLPTPVQCLWPAMPMQMHRLVYWHAAWPCIEATGCASGSCSFLLHSRKVDLD